MTKRVLLAATALLVALPTARAFADSSSKDYAAAIAQAQADLNAGRVAEAVKRLEATDTKRRRFENEYLLARAKAAKDQKAAPDLVHTLAAPKVDHRYAVLNEVDRQLAFICRDGKLRVYDLNSPAGEPRTVSHGEGGAIWSGAFSNDGKTFVSGNEAGEVVIWDAKNWKVRHAVTLGPKWAVRELAVAPDGATFVAESEKTLELWSLAGDKPKKVNDVGERYTFGEGLAFSPKGDLVATGGMFDILLHDTKTGAETKSMRHASYTMGLEFSPDGKRIASAPRGNVNKFLSVFDIDQGKSLFVAGPFPDYVAGLAFTPDGERVIATGPSKSLRLFDAATGEVVLALPRPDHTAKPAVSRDGRLVGWYEPGSFCYIDLGK
jgi:WD40 repeat protein